MRLYIYFILSFYILFCCFTSIEALIGDNVRAAEENEFPFIVAIAKDYQENNLSLSYFCAGTLISRKDVLTSAHCLSAQQLSGIRILIGSSYLYSGRIYYPLCWITFDVWARQRNRDIRNNMNDIAILNLLLLVRRYIVPARISNLQLEALFGMEAKVAGWGLLQNNTIPNILQVAAVNIISQTECEERISSLVGEITYGNDVTVCSVADPYVLLRPGDSGGPLFYGNTLLAINFGTCPFPALDVNPEKVNVHVLISFYMEFITDQSDYQ